MQPEQFHTRVVDDSASLLDEWRVVAKTTGGEPVDKFNFDGMRWTLGKRTLDIVPTAINLAGAAASPSLKCSYSVDNSQTPAHFNWTLGEGEKSVEVNAIYELKDDLLRVCFPQHGEPRPTGFETKGQKWSVYEFKRISKD